MTYVLVSRDPRSGMEARTSVHNRFLANYVGMRELDRGWELLAIHATDMEAPLDVNQVTTTRAIRARWRHFYGQDFYRDESVRAEREIGAYR
ncbi:MAG TPA: hypothetical protein VGG27_04620 [Magnetospirillaceae bacterium]|jgi:hypothetical protein